MSHANTRLSALLSLAVCALPAHAATIFVSPCGSNGWTGTSAVCAAPLGPKRTIQAAINAANPGDFVHVLPGTYVEQIDLQGKAITLLGTGGAAATIIDGSDDGSVVTCNSLEGPSTIIRGFTIRNGYAPKGGGMLIALANPTIEECIIRENFADDLGAGVACVAASPTFTDCQFIANEADVGGADADGSGGGLSVEGGAPDFTNCDFIGNGARDAGGGAAVFNASPQFTDCHFETNAQWTYCPGEPCNPPQAGSAVVSVNGSPAFESCTFLQNRTGGHGAVAVSGGSAEFVSCQFNENSSVWSPDPFQRGGALAGQEGAELTLLGCSFTENQSNNSAGAIHLNEASLSASLCGFFDNIADVGHGGAIEAVNSTTAITGCTFLQNRSRDGGGAISADGGALGVSTSVFTSNVTAYELAVRGSGIVASGGAIEVVDAFAEVTSSTFFGNTSEYKGGAIARNPQGGAVFSDLESPDLVIENCTFEENTSAYGGGVEISSGVAHVSASNFELNQAFSDAFGGVGGGLSAGPNGYARILDTEFLDNTAADSGGAMSVYGLLDAVACTISGNTATQGGGVYASSGGTFANLYSCRLTGNTATDRGSAAFMSYSAGMNLVNCVVARNTAPANSAAIVTGSEGTSIEPLRVTNCTIHLNSGGGGIMSNDAAIPVFVSNSIIWGHSGPEVAIFQGAVEYSDVQGGHPGEGNIDANPSWVGALGGNYHLNANSPCIDAGRTAALPQDAPDLDTDDDSLELIPLDFDGNPRVADVIAKADTGCAAGTIVDMGAFEVAGVVAPPTMPGDANGDGQVNFADITEVLTNWGFCPGSCCPSDVDHDGDVDFADITEVLTFWGLGA